MGADEIRAVLAAYKQVMDASWPDLHPAMAQESRRWDTASDAELARELAGYLREASVPSCHVRIFWKLGTQFAFGGCNDHFAHDAGLGGPTDILGLDDFDRRLPWVLQAAKYRADDEQVFKSGVPKLDILERQKSTTGITWVRAGKAPIRTAAGTVIGILGMYQVLDPEVGRRLFAEQNRRRKPHSA